jgi:hypothetical protein
MRRLILSAAFISLAAPALLSAVTWQEQVDAVIGWKGQDMPDGVHRYTLTPHLSLTIAGVPVLPNLVLDGYAAFKHESGTWLLAAELAGPESRIDAMVEEADIQGLHTTAVHNHVMHESPRVKFIHITATGEAVHLARALKAVIARSGLTLATDDDRKDADDTSALDIPHLESIMKSTADIVDGVVEFTFDHPGSFTNEGLSFPPAMGPESEIHFQSIGQGHAACVSEFAVTGREALAAIHVLRKSGVDVEIQALHNHFLFESPRLFFLHTWATGSPSTLAHLMRAVLDAIGQ